MEQVINDIRSERERQKTLEFDGVPSVDFDKENSQGDWIAYITRYASGAHPKLGVNDGDGFRSAMVKVAALAIAAIENYDAGNC